MFITPSIQPLPFSEYLVNFDYLTQALETYGFIPVPADDERYNFQL